MNSTHTPTPDTTAATEATERTEATASRGTEVLITKFERAYLTSELWLGLLHQDQYWVPRGSWDVYAEASLDPSLRRVKPRFDIAGIVHVEDMQTSWRQSVLNFMWRKSASIAAGQGYGPFLLDSNPYEQFDVEDDMRFHALARDAAKRAVWFDGLTLVQTLRTSVIAERDARISRPTLLTAAAAPQPHRSGLLLPRA